MERAPITVTMHGAGSDGLICGYVFDAQGLSRPVGTVAEVLASPPVDGFAWLHLNLSHNGSAAALEATGIVPADFVKTPGTDSRASRIDIEAHTLCAVLNDLTFDFHFDASNTATLWVFVGERMVVSARLHPLRSVDQLRMAIRRGDVLASPLALLNHLLSDQADELQRMVRTVTERVDEIEDQLLAGRGPHGPGELIRLRRLLVRLHRLLTPEPTALARTLSSPLPWMQPDDLHRLHRSSEEFALVLRDIGALQDRARFVQDDIAGRATRDNAKLLFALTAITALALPINLVAGLFGMNLEGAPLAKHPAGFWIVSLTVVTTTVVLALVGLRLFRRRRRDR
jgi:zinc transporter